MIDTSNPYQSPQPREEPTRHFPTTPGARASLVSKGLLYRRIQIEAPIEAELEFHGRSMRDVIRMNQEVVASSISWWRITPAFDFTVGTDLGDKRVSVALEIGPMLSIKRFQVSIDDVMVYQEPV